MSSPIVRSGLVLYVVRTAAGLLLALPLTASIAETLSPVGGEAKMLHDGGALALEALDAARGSLGRALLGGGVSLAVASLLSLAPLGVVIARLSKRAPLGLVELVRAATRPFAGLAVLLGVATLLELLATLGASLGLHALAGRAFVGDRRTADLARWAAQLLAFGPLLLIGVVHDVARCAHVARDLGFYDATARALAVFRARFGVLFGHYVVRGAASLSLLLFAVYFTLSRGMGSVAGLVTCVVVQQVALFGAALLRASWLARVLAIDASMPAPRASDASGGG